MAKIQQGHVHAKKHLLVYTYARKLGDSPLLTWHWFDELEDLHKEADEVLSLREFREVEIVYSGRAPESFTYQPDNMTSIYTPKKIKAQEWESHSIKHG